jgi:hypothetical protein
MGMRANVKASFTLTRRFDIRALERVNWQSVTSLFGSVTADNKGFQWPKGRRAQTEA